MTKELKVMILDEEINRVVHNLNEYIQDYEIDKFYTVPPLEDGEFVEKSLQVYRNLDKLGIQKEVIDLIEGLIKIKQEINNKE